MQLTLGDPMDCSPLVSSVRGILQARILEWVAVPSSRGSSHPRDRTRSLMSPALQIGWASHITQSVKHLPAMWKTQVRFLGWEDPLEKEMAIHSSILAWRIPWTEEPSRLQSM